MNASTKYITSKYITSFSENIEDIKSDVYGGKAYWINWIHANGYNTPKSYFISSELSFERDEKINVEMDNLFDICMENFKKRYEESSYNAVDKLGLAVRSSSTVEDGFSESKAGNFESFLGDMDRKALKDNYLKVLKSQALDEKGKMGVIVQELIEPVLSGVIFSSNPLNFSKDEVLLSIIKGYGDKLMSGTETGKDIVMKLDCGRLMISEFDFDILENKEDIKDNDIKLDIGHFVEELAYISKDMENKLGYPVDIEWVINEDNEIVIIQVRPINNFILNENRIDLVNIENMSQINKRLIDSDKINLRLKAEESDVFISDAYLLTLDCSMDSEVLYKSIDNMISKVKRSDKCVGYSAVILSPKNVDGKIVRAFIGDPDKVDKESLGEIVSHPRYTDLSTCIKAFAEIAKDSYWTISIIIQEIFEPEFTGILNKSGNHFIVEIAKGHFASKGILPMSRYIIWEGVLMDSAESIQDNMLCIKEGYVYEELLSGDKQKVKMNLSELNNITEKFSKFYRDGILVEFGVLSGNIPYLIDTFEIESEKQITESCIREIKEGIICPGNIEGKLVKLDNLESSSIDLHFMDSMENEDVKTEKTVFYSKYPDISFLKIIEKYDNRNISFIFEQGSVLCHFSILLRERDIPSIVGYDINKLQNGEYFTLEV